MSLENVVIERGYREYQHMQVFACRVVTHAIAPQSGQKSENHLAIYLLIGSGSSVRVDMKPGDDCLGFLQLSGHNFAQSNSALDRKDILAVVPGDSDLRFDLDNTPMRQGENSVNTFVNSLLGANKHQFRYLFNDGRSKGCGGFV